MARLRSSTLAFLVPGALVVAISLFLTLRQRTSAQPPRLSHFSGSRVVLAMPSLLPAARLPARLRVAIVRDPAAASFYDSPATLDTIVRAWRDLLAAAGADVRVVRPGEVRGSAARVIVVPSSPCLSLETREAIDRAGARGQGLIVAGPVGTHDAGCRAIGYGLVVAMTGASRAEVLRDRPMVYVAIPGDGPLAVGIPPGARLEIDPATQVALRTSARDAFFADYALGSAPAQGEPFLDAAVVRSTYRGARAVYFGFELRDTRRTSWNREILALLVRNAAAWTGDVPLAWIEPWPGGRGSAAVIAQDVENGFGNARYALDSLRAAGVASTWFLISDLARRNVRLTRRMAEAGEIGTHTENHQLLGGLPFERQRERLRVTQRDLSRMLGRPVHGLRPPEEQFDEATMAAWLASGGGYLLGVNDGRCAAPELLRVRGDTLVLVPRVFGDDFAAAGPESRRSPAVVGTLMRAEWGKARTLGGLYVLSYHSQLLAREEYVPALARLARAMATDSTVWLTTAGAVAEWWRGRSSLEARVVRRSATRLELVLRNREHRVVENLVLHATLPRGFALRRTGAPRLPAEPGAVRVLVPMILGRATVTIPLEAER